MIAEYKSSDEELNTRLKQYSERSKARRSLVEKGIQELLNRYHFAQEVISLRTE